MNNSAIHSLLDIALTTPRDTADVFFHYWPHCGTVDIQIYAGSWSEEADPGFSSGANIAHDLDVRKLLSDTKAFLSSINPAETRLRAAQDRIAKAREELRDAERALSAWTPESEEPCPMDQLHTFSVPENKIEAHEAMEVFDDGEIPMPIL